MQQDTDHINAALADAAEPPASGDAQPPRPKAWSHSSLEVLRRSAEDFDAVYISKTQPRTPPTAEMVLGTLFDLYVLSPAKWDQRVSLVDHELDMRTNKDKALVSELTAGKREHYVVDPPTLAKLEDMAASLRAHPEASEFLLEARTQAEMRWTDAETGLPLCAYVDLEMIEHRNLMADVKTASDPSPWAFAKSAGDKGYHRQAALYQAGAAELHGGAASFLHVVVGTKRPHQTAVYRFSERDLELGRRQVREGLRELRDRLERGDWRSEWARGVVDLTLPPWAHYNR